MSELIDDYSYSKLSLTQDLDDVSSINSTSTIRDQSENTQKTSLAIKTTREALSKLNENMDLSDHDDDLQGLRKRLSSYASNPRYQKAIKKVPK